MRRDSPPAEGGFLSPRRQLFDQKSGQNEKEHHAKLGGKNIPAGGNNAWKRLRGGMSLGHVGSSRKAGVAGAE